MATMAGKVAELADNDGSYFPEEFKRALEAAPSITSKAGGSWSSPIRYGWSDGSAIVVCGDIWDFGVHRDRLAEAARRFEPSYGYEDLLPDGDPTPEYLVRFEMVGSFEYTNSYEEPLCDGDEEHEQPEASPTDTDTAQILKAPNGNIRRIIPPGHVLHDDSRDGPIVEEYWVPYPQGYVRLVTEDCPTTLGRQVAVGLRLEGHTLIAYHESLLETIQDHHAIAMHNSQAAESISRYGSGHGP